MDMLTALVGSLMAKYPMVVSILAVVGLLRAIFKPLFVFLEQVAAATKTDVDNKILDDVEHSKIYSALSFILDWAASIKLPQ